MTKANECTCPSGDGSLRHPCPAHIGPFDKLVGSPVHNESEPDLPPLDEHLAQVFETGMALSESVDQAGGDERAKFEERMMENGRDISTADGGYLDPLVERDWKARAALAQPSPAKPEQAEAERPEVAEVAFVLRNIGAMDAEDIDGDNVDLRFEDAEGRDTGCDVSIVEYAEKAADLLEQQDRIVGELRADRDSWAEQAEQRLADWDEMRKERDAALARVEELERQEPVALANRGLHAFWVKWTEAAAGLYGPGIKLYAAPVAQAGQVPAAWYYDAPSQAEAAIIDIRGMWGEDDCPTYEDVASALRRLLAGEPGKEGV
ncbi:hypothetical protein ACP0H8_05845 [Pseudomonas aeruginosa]